MKLINPSGVAAIPLGWPGHFSHFLEPQTKLCFSLNLPTFEETRVFLSPKKRSVRTRAKPCDRMLDTHRGGVQARRPLTEPRAKQQEQARLGDGCTGRTQLPLPEGIPADGTERQGELARWARGGAGFLGSGTARARPGALELPLENHRLAVGKAESEGSGRALFSAWVTEDQGTAEETRRGAGVTGNGGGWGAGRAVQARPGLSLEGPSRLPLELRGQLEKNLSWAHPCPRPVGEPQPEGRSVSAPPMLCHLQGAVGKQRGPETSVDQSLSGEQD